VEYKKILCVCVCVCYVCVLCCIVNKVIFFLGPHSRCARKFMKNENNNLRIIAIIHSSIRREDMDGTHLFCCCCDVVVAVDVIVRCVCDRVCLGC